MVAPQPPAHLQPADAGEHEVEHHDVGGRAGREGQGGRAVGGPVHVEAGPFQVGAHDVPDRGVVVDDEGAAHGPRIGAAPSRRDLAGRGHVRTS